SATISSAWYSTRVRASPRRTASVILPDSLSVWMSRRLLATSTADDSEPIATASASPTQSTRSVWVYWVPSTATSPKNTNTATSPRPRYPYGFDPPVYSQAPAMHAAPTAMSHGWLTIARASPAAAPTHRLITAAVSTAFGEASREPTRRSGPARTSSVPRMPSE